MSDTKECFFISPIGDRGSDTRERSDNVLEYIIEEVLTDYEYSVTRADQMDQPGSITNQVIEKTVESELVIADLTGHNPNVFYELAVRHATGKPYIQLIDVSESIPFDIADLRTVQYGLEVDEAQQARDELRAQLDTMEDGDTEFDNPISKSAEMRSLRKSDNPTDQNIAEIMNAISELSYKMNNIEEQVNQDRRSGQQGIAEFVREDTIPDEERNEIEERFNMKFEKAKDRKKDKK